MRLLTTPVWACMILHEDVNVTTTNVNTDTMAKDEQVTQAENQEPEPLMAGLAFRATKADKDALRMIAFWNEETESEVIRRWFDFDGFRAEAEEIRALRESKKESAVA